MRSKRFGLDCDLHRVCFGLVADWGPGLNLGLLLGPFHCGVCILEGKQKQSNEQKLLEKAIETGMDELARGSKG